jgi:hypothetical protein
MGSCIIQSMHLRILLNALSTGQFWPMETAMSSQTWRYLMLQYLLYKICPGALPTYIVSSVAPKELSGSFGPIESAYAP